MDDELYNESKMVNIDEEIPYRNLLPEKRFPGKRLPGRRVRTPEEIEAWENSDVGKEEIRKMKERHATYWKNSVGEKEEIRKMKERHDTYRKNNKTKKSAKRKPTKKVCNCVKKRK